MFHKHYRYATGLARDSKPGSPNLGLLCFVSLHSFQANVLGDTFKHHGGR
jgi:hypothetical protein